MKDENQILLYCKNVLNPNSIIQYWQSWSRNIEGFIYIYIQIFKIKWKQFRVVFGINLIFNSFGHRRNWKKKFKNPPCLKHKRQFCERIQKILNNDSLPINICFVTHHLFTNTKIRCNAYFHSWAHLVKGPCKLWYFVTSKNYSWFQRNKGKTSICTINTKLFFSHWLDVTGVTGEHFRPFIELFLTI